MQEIRSNELDSHVNFKMLNGKECKADFYCFLTECQHSIVVKIEDLTLVVISYEIYETSLRRVSKISYEMTTSVRFSLSYDNF